MLDHISVRGARQHNLKNIDLDIPKNKLVVFTGISGSGKSSLAFDTIYAEGQRRYIESLSAYARQFLGQGGKPDVDSIEGLSPAISIDQKSTSHNPRSTVGTVTEVHDYLRLLYAKVGIPHCPNDGSVVSKASIDEIMDAVLAGHSEPSAHDPEHSASGQAIHSTSVRNRVTGSQIQVIAPLARGRKGEYKELLDTLYKEGFAAVELDGETATLTEDNARLDKQKKHTILVTIDEFVLTSDNLSRLAEAIEQAAEKSEGSVLVRDANGEQSFNLALMCPKCGESFPELEPRSFSFNSPFGACPECDGLGLHSEIDRALVVPDQNKTISDAAILPWTYSSKNWYGFTITAVCEYYNIDMQRPFKNLKDHERELLLDGPGNPVQIPAVYYSQGKRNVFHVRFNGILPLLERRWKETESDAVRRDIEKYMTQYPCPECKGKRLKPLSLLVTIGDSAHDREHSASGQAIHSTSVRGRVKAMNIAEVSELSIVDSRAFFSKITLEGRDKIIADRPIREIQARLGFLEDVGLGYLSLGRRAATLAGGEAQRIRLASQVGSRLTGVLYVLDEPSIGLHARDNTKLISVLKELRDLGNSVIVVEHDEETIEAADYLVDIGPKAGKHGGEIVAQGSVSDVAAVERSLTGQYLAGKRYIPIPAERRRAKQFLSIYGARENNLKRLNVQIPLGVFAVVTGVSGSGKSTLVNDVIYKALARGLNKSLVKPGGYERIEGMENLKRIVLISQAPIGRTPRSNPATYTGLFGAIRDLFAATREARIRGYKPGRFSFNVSGGRCESCAGDGLIRIEMQFLPDVYVSCDICNGKRYNRETLQVHFAGKTIADVLNMTVEEALTFFADFPSISDKLQLLSDVGLGYVELGQSATTLSGGEAQRIKLATELARRTGGQALYVLDEPTTGLHTYDIQQLLEVLNRLVDQGNTVLVIEHNLDVIAAADWLIDLGPEGGEGGGKLMGTGTPEALTKVKDSYTGLYLAETLKKHRARRLANTPGVNQSDNTPGVFGKQKQK